MLSYPPAGSELHVQIGSYLLRSDRQAASTSKLRRYPARAPMEILPRTRLAMRRRTAALVASYTRREDGLPP